MLTEEENRFVRYWEEHRNRKRKWLWKLAVGLPLGLVFAGGILMASLSGWYKRAMMEMRTDPSAILVLLAAIMGIVVFIAVFSARHSWEMNEQRYKELLNKKNKPESHTGAAE